MATAKQQLNQKFALLRYPNDSQFSALHPDNYNLWKEPKDWKTVRSEIVAVTAREAKQMFERANPSNKVRRKQSQVNRVRGWIDGGIYALMDTIEFDWDGTLQNGHHRLEAISLSNGIVLVNVVYGVNPENYSKYDDNYKRSAGNIIGIGMELEKGEADDIASAAKWTHLFWSGIPLESRQAVHGRDRIKDLQSRPDMVQHNADFDAMVERAEADLPCPKSILLTLLTLGCEIANAKGITRDFIKAVVTGEDIKAGDPAYESGHPILRFVTVDAQRVNLFPVNGGTECRQTQTDFDAGVDALPFGVLVLEEKSTVLSTQQEEFFEELAKEAKEAAKNKLLTKMNTNNKFSTPLVDFEIFGKRTLNALSKNLIVTMGDLALVNNDVMLRRMLNSKAYDEVKNFVNVMEIPTVKA